ncbi:MAG: hypothetical protein JXB45_07180, partial [Candidatus Krumholzibacteriota bacterium]|nr:hypothetical protein [Candidatus Krumholzibacteriota bacterium]
MDIRIDLHSRAGACFVAACIILPVFSPFSLRGADDPTCSLCELVSAVDPERIEKTIRELSGADTVYIAGQPQVLFTRFALSPRKLLALEYLLDEVRDLGFDPRVQTFTLNVQRPDLMGVALSGSGDTLWAGAIEGKVYRGLTSGDWNDFSLCAQLDMMIWNLKVDGRGRLWAGGKQNGISYGALYYSDDGGESWELKYAGNSANNIRTIQEIDFWKGEEAMAVGAYGTIFSMTYLLGEWWVKEIGPEKVNYLSLHGTAASGARHWWVVGDVGYLFETENQGGDWNGVSLTTASLYDIDFYDARRGVIVGDKITFHTVDGGASWNEVAVDATLRTVCLIDSLTVAAGGTGGDIWMSLDGGA